MVGRPKLNSPAEQELDKVEKQLEAFNDNVNKLTMDRMNEAPKEEVEPQTKLSQNEIRKSTDVYLKPFKTIGCRDKFNEKFRTDYNYDKEYVQFIAEHKELIGETIEIWTRPYGGVPAEFWKVPTNKPIWGPRYLAEQISKKKYHRLVMKQNVSVNSDQMGEYYGSMAADTTIQRLDAYPVSTRKSIFVGASGFQ